MKKQLRGSIILLLAAIIWGGAFVAQSEAMDHVTPFTYNAARMLIGGLTLVPVILITDAFRDREKRTFAPGNRAVLRASLLGGVICGVILAGASSFQQFGIAQTTVGKAGFVTALYIVLVPICNALFKKKIPPITWVCVVIAIAGFYLLCIKEDFTIARGDLLVLCCAVIYTFHIITIDRFNERAVDGVLMACVQFFVCGVITLVCALLFEEPSFAALWNARVSLAYTGILSCGAAFTFQILGQRDCEPTAATLIMSLESVFSALFGWMILHQSLSGKELAGCALVFTAVVLAQVPLPKRKK